MSKQLITSFIVNYAFVGQRRIAIGFAFESNSNDEPLHNQEAVRQAIIDVQKAIDDRTDYVFPEKHKAPRLSELTELDLIIIRTAIQEGLEELTKLESRLYPRSLETDKLRGCFYALRQKFPREIIRLPLRAGRGDD